MSTNKVIKRSSLTFKEYRSEPGEDQVIHLPYQKRLFFASILSKYKHCKEDYISTTSTIEENILVDLYIQMLDYYQLLPEQIKQKCPIPQVPILKDSKQEIRLSTRLNKNR